MKSIYYDDYEDFACAVIDTLDEITESDDCNDISIITKYESANQILKELLCLGCDVASVELHREAFEEYWDEYLVSVSKHDEKYEVWCEKFKREKGYIPDESTVTYIMDDCNSDVIPFCKGNLIYEVAIGEYECDGDCEDCNCNDDLVSSNSESVTLSKDKDGTVHGFSKSWSDCDEFGNTYYSSYSHYSSDENMVKKIARDFGIDI